MQLDDKGLFLFDVSKWQAKYDQITNVWTYINWDLMRASGVSAVICKAGQYNFKDFTFDHNWREAKRVGLPRASYWFLDYRLSGTEQARKYWTIMKDDPGEGPLVIDYEQGSGGDWDRLYNFILELQRLSGYPNERIWIYTGYFYWIEHSPETIAQRQWFAKYPLWLAWYANTPEFVQLPDMWTECILWQKGTPTIGYSVGAQSAEIDYNVFNGDKVKFVSYFGEGSDPPPTGDTMYFKASTTINIRSSAGVTTTNDLGLFNILTNDIVEVEPDPVIVGTTTWRKIRKIWRNDQPVTFVPSPSNEYWCAERVGTTTPLVQTNYIPPVTARHVVEVWIDSVLVYRQELT
jgi:GH25 family lysozyme M1 (1,4-beta-N-acetylmuramidase)